MDGSIVKLPATSGLLFTQRIKGLRSMSRKAKPQNKEGDTVLSSETELMMVTQPQLPPPGSTYQTTTTTISTTTTTSTNIPTTSTNIPTSNSSSSSLSSSSSSSLSSLQVSCQQLQDRQVPPTTFQSFSTPFQNGSIRPGRNLAEEEDSHEESGVVRIYEKPT